MKNNRKALAAAVMAFIILAASIPLPVRAQPKENALTEQLQEIAQADQSGETGPAFVPGELIVCLKGESDADLLGSSLQGVNIPGGLQWEKLIDLEETAPAGEEDAALLSAAAEEETEPSADEIKWIGLVKAGGCETKEQLEKLARQLESLPDVVYAEPNRIYQVESTGNDLTFRQWAYAENTEMPQFAGNVHMGVDDPAVDRLTNWNEYEEDGETPDPIIHPEQQDMVVAVIDTGIDYTHPDMKNVMWDEGENYGELKRLGGGKFGCNTVRKNSKGETYSSDDPMDDNSHGTHCAGIIGAEWNGEGVSGAVTGVRLMAVKAGDDAGRLNTSNILRGFAYVAQAMRCGVNVVAINNSWGGPQAAGRAIDDCITELGRLGAVFCMAAGNETNNKDITSGDYLLSQHNPYLVVVDAMDKDGNLTAFTNFGKRMTDVAAPGARIYSTIPISKAVADPLAKVPTPSVAVRGKAMDTFETAQVEEGTVTNVFFDYSETKEPVITDKGYLGGKALEISSEEQKKKDPAIEGATLVMKIRTDEYAKEEKPTHFGMALCVTKGAENAGVRMYGIFAEDSNGKQLSLTLGGFDPGVWQSVSFLLPETDEKELTIKLQVTASAADYSAVYDTVVQCDNIMLTNTLQPYEYKDGTSMATPAVTGEAAAIMAAHYSDKPYTELGTEEKSYRAMETAARIRGSVEKMTKEEDREKVGSGGYARLDYALHGNTQPVLVDLTRETVDGQDTVLLRGFYLNGMTGTDPEGRAVEGGDGIAALLIDGKDITDRILESDENGHWIRFAWPETMENGEHVFSVVTEEGRKGQEFLFTGVSEQYFERIPLSDKTVNVFAYTRGVSLVALKDRLYYIGQGLSCPQLENNHAGLWSAGILHAGTAGQTVSPEWELVKDLGDNESEAVSMTACDGKLYITKESGGKLHILRYTPETGQWEDTVPEDPALEEMKVIPDLARICFSSGRLLLSAYRLVEEGGNQTPYSAAAELDPETLKVKSLTAFHVQLPYRTQVIGTEEAGRFLIIGGLMSGTNPMGRITELRLEEEKAVLTDLAEDIRTGLGKYKETSDRSFLSMAQVKGGYIAAGPVLYGEDGRTLSDAYAVDGAVTKVRALDRLFAPTAMDSIVMTAYKGKVYLMAKEQEASGGTLFAGMDAGTLPAEGDAPLHQEEPEGTENSVSYPSYVDQNGSWRQEATADGRQVWTFCKANGQQAAGEWVAVACRTWRTDGTGAFRWFRFGADGIMQTGWYTDTDGRRYYLNPEAGTEQGSMVTGWKEIEGRWYYFSEAAGSGSCGVLFVNTATPDGYQVGGDGAWIETKKTAG